LNGYVDFPHAAQVMRIERTVTKLDGTPIGGKRPDTEVCFAITSVPPERASAAKLLETNRVQIDPRHAASRSAGAFLARWAAARRTFEMAKRAR
jgi:hypothetical protein